jgi:hypothetical protein
MRCGKHFADKVFGCLCIACRTQEEVQCIAQRVYCSIQVRPSAFEMRSAALLQFRCIVLHPAIDRGMVNMLPPFQHHFFHVSVAERVAQVPTNTEQNNLSFEVSLFEKGAIIHEVGSSPSSESPKTTGSSSFLQYNHKLITDNCCSDLEPTQSKSYIHILGHTRIEQVLLLFQDSNDRSVLQIFRFVFDSSLSL